MPPRNKKAAKKSPVEKTQVQEKRTPARGKKTPARGKKTQKTQKAKAPAAAHASLLVSTPKTPSPLLGANERFMKRKSLVKEFEATAAAAAKDVPQASTSTSGRPAAAAALGAPPVAPLAQEELQADDQAGGEDSSSDGILESPIRTGHLARSPSPPSYPSTLELYPYPLQEVYPYPLQEVNPYPLQEVPRMTRSSGGLRGTAVPRPPLQPPRGC
jgi:hypothetical protein